MLGGNWHPTEDLPCCTRYNFPRFKGWKVVSLLLPPPGQSAFFDQRTLNHVILLDYSKVADIGFASSLKLLISTPSFILRTWRLCLDRIGQTMSSEQEARNNDEDYFPPPAARQLDPEQTDAPSHRHESSFAYDDERLYQSRPQSPFGFEGTRPGREAEAEARHDTDLAHQERGDAAADDVLPSKHGMSTTHELAQEHGVQHPTRMYAQCLQDTALYYYNALLSSVDYC